MFEFTIPFFLNFIYFFISIFIASFIPGHIILQKIKLSLPQQIILSLSVGIVLWAWQGLIFGYLHNRWMSYIYLFINIIIWIKFAGGRFIHELILYLRNFKPDKIILLLLTVGVIIQVSTVWFNGTKTDKGLFFCCGQNEDNLLQISISDQIVRQIPPFEPGMYGTYIHNYHYWNHLVLGELIRVFKLPLIATQFQYATILISLLLGLNAIILGQLLGLKKSFTYWLLFFLYMGGDLIFLLTFLLNQGFNFSMSSLEDGSKFLSNYPRAFAIMLYFTGLNLLIVWLKKKDKLSGLIMALVLGSLIGFKVYVGFFALAGSAILALYYFVLKKSKYSLYFLLIILLSLIIYLPVNYNSGGIFFIGLWLFENFATQQALGLNNIILAHYIYLDHQNLPRIIMDELFFAYLYIMGVFGTKLIGLIQTKKSLLLFSKEFNIFLSAGILLSLICGLFFQQQSGGANTFNFIVSVFIIASIYCALSLSYGFEKIKKKYIKYLLILIIVALTIPRVIYEVKTNIFLIMNRQGFTITNEELQAFSELKKQSRKNSLILIDDRAFPIEKDSAYVGFITERPIYLSGLGILNSHGVNSTDRQLAKKTILASVDPVNIGNTLKGNKIEFVVTDPSNHLGSTYSASFIKNIYQNQKVKILKFSEPDFEKYLKNQ